MIPSKLPHIGTTIFTKMSALARQHGAINLSQGFPDFTVDTKLTAYLYEATKQGHNQYAPMEGLLTLREKIAQKYHALYGVDYHPQSEITITAGATQAIFTAIATLISKGDEVIMFTPAYDCYAPTVQLFGGVCKFVKLEHPNYSINWKEVDAQLSDKTKLIILNTPHNPTGSILSDEDMSELSKRVEKHTCFVISDEVYEHIIFDGEKHASACKYPALKERTFIVASFGKTLHATGWKVGYCVAPEALTKEFRKAHQFNVFCVNHPAQYAIDKYMEDESTYLGLPSFYQQKRDYFLDLTKGSQLTFLPCKGTYFCVADYSKISALGDVEFCEWMTKEKGLAAIPLSVFYDDATDHKLIRLCFAKNEETLEKAAQIIRQL
jgi:methionine aminotransferase